MVKAFYAFVSFVSFVFIAAPVAAQPADLIGVRATGMGGAFTAVADDATASWWNPAGIAGGAYFNALIETGHHNEPSAERTPSGDPQPAWRAEMRNLAIAYPALALSYYRLRVSEIQPLSSTAPASAGRQDGGLTGVRLRALVFNQFGASVGQSFGSHFVVATTLKLVHAGAAVQNQPAATGSLDTADSLDPATETHAGLDVGAMATMGPARIGLMVRNVTKPDFGSGPDAFTLDRHARLGVALTSGRRGAIGAATLAVDGDLTRDTTVFGEERRLAAGGELWTPTHTFGVRGGAGVNTLGDRRTSLSGGLSAAIKKGMYADAELTGGTDQGRKGWSVGLRVTF